MLLGGVTVQRKGRNLSRVVSHRDIEKHKNWRVFERRSFWFEDGVDLSGMSCVLKKLLVKDFGCTRW